MTTRFVALRYDSLNACTGGRATFCNTGRGSNEHDACCTQSTDALGRRHSEMETHDARPSSHQRGQHRVVIDETAVDLSQSLGRTRAELSELRAKILEPRCLARSIGLR
jgi:hypothetical protein